MIKLKERSNFYNINFAIIERVIGIIATVVMTSLLARKLGPEIFGLYQHYASIIFVATAMTWLVSAESLNSRLDSSGYLSKEIFESVFFARLMNGSLIYIICSVYIYIKNDVLMALVLLMMLPFVFVEALSSYKFVIESSGRMYISAKIRTMSAIVKLLLLLLIYLKDLDVIFIGILIFFEAAINCGFYYLVGSSFVDIRSLKLNLKNIFFLIKSGLVVFIGLVSLYFFQRIDRIMFSHNVNGNEFGNYTAAMTIIDQFNTITLIVVNILAAKLVYRQDEDNISENYIKLVKFIILLSMVSTICVFYLSGYAINLIFGKEYVESIIYMSFLCFSIPIFSIDAVINVFIFKKKYFLLFSLKYLFASTLYYVFINFYFGNHDIRPIDLFCTNVMCYTVIFILSISYFYFKVRPSNEKN